MNKVFYKSTGSVAQWLEQGIHKPKVTGSISVRAIIFFFLSASDWV